MDSMQDVVIQGQSKMKELFSSLDYNAAVQLLAQHPGAVIMGLGTTYVAYRYLTRPRNLPPGPNPWPILGKIKSSYHHTTQGDIM